MIKGLFQFIFGLIRLVFFILILVLIFHTWAIKQTLIFSLSYSLGADVSIQSVKMDWKNTGFEVQGMEIGNPYGFSKGLLAEIPLAIISLDLPSVTKGIFRFKTVGFNLRELQVMNVPQRGLNILALKPFQKKEEDESPSQAAIRRQVNKYTPPLLIDELIFSVEDISYLDMSKSSLRQNRYRAGIQGATYYNIQGVNDVAMIVATEAFKKMGFSYFDAQLQKFQKSYGYQSSKPKGFLGRTLDSLKQKLSE
ncbi:MAG TPA: hypothetical protein PLO78_02450 [Candidatus Omnitrophota bacterium]|nr:hypothetical protein [Candidatus Omnitrophota bacterium]